LALLAPGCGLLVASTQVTTAMAAVPTTVDSYGANGFASAVHVVINTNNDPNFSQGAIGNRYPLTQVSQDVAPAAQALASLNDVGPLVLTVAGNDCNGPPPYPLPQGPPPPPIPDPNAGKQPGNYCLETIRENAPYAHAQYPHPPGVGDASVTGPGGQGLFGTPPIPQNVVDAVGIANAHAEELKAHADGAYGGPAPIPGAVAVTNAVSQSDSGLATDGTLTVTTHARVGSACFGDCVKKVNYLVVNNVDVVTTVVALNGKAHPNATVIVGQVLYCATEATCQPVQVDSNGVTVGGFVPATAPPAPLPGLGGPLQVPVQGVGGSGDLTVFHLRTVNPNQHTNNGIGSVDALGLDVAVSQPGNGGAGIPNTSVEYILGEGHSDGFSVASVPFTETSTPVSALTAHLGAVPSYQPVSGAGGSNHTRTIRTRSPSLGLAGAFRPPFTYLFYGWEASVLAAAGSLIWARRRKLDEDAE
jgi:hypothetical protein